MTSRKGARSALLILTVFGLLSASADIPAQALNDRALHQQVRELLRNRIEASGTPAMLEVGGSGIYACRALPVFYERRSYLPAWIEGERVSPMASELLAALRSADAEGLNPADYHLFEIERLLKQAGDPPHPVSSSDLRTMVDLDLALTDAFLIYGSHTVAGRVNPETIDSEWLANRRDVDMVEVLDRALSSKAVLGTLESLRPSGRGYSGLRNALVDYRDINTKGGWPFIPAGPKMQRGDFGDRIRLLRKRLETSGDLPAGDIERPDSFDESLEEAVKLFQRRHGLDIDGVVGPATLSALNVPTAARVSQIEVNMERWRWLPEDLGRRYVFVNIANFELDVVEDKREVITMRAIVGRDYRRTPVFSDRMTYLVLSPFWNVPPSLAAQDILPQVRKDPNYLAQKGMRVFEGWGSDTKEIDPLSVDWSSITGKNLRYRFRQDPGPSNSLGRVKFMFPNKFNVYLHDTPSRDLFQKTARAFSSGCIRIENPIELSEYLLQGDPRWDQSAILAAIDRRIEQTVNLPEPIPVHLLYWTAWVDAAGIANFREDIYGRDKLVAEALAEKPPE
jgi:murein L,D-transpeptidase YcbB/YkuD